MHPFTVAHSAGPNRAKVEIHTKGEIGRLSTLRQEGRSTISAGLSMLSFSVAEDVFQ
jgi:hypothetical protein